MNEELYKRLVKIKALADRGVGGEAENARQMFNQILDREECTLFDFENFGEKETFIERKLVYGSHEFKLFSQIAAMLELGIRAPKAKYKEGQSVAAAIIAAQSQIARFEMLWDIYWPELQRELNLSLGAFIQANRIFRNTNAKPRELTDEEMEIYKRSLALEKVATKRLK